ncbi:MAG: OsmC family protein [Rickettsiales bacterium]|nr:OsmC family protein [Rickettsiales bacterium]
MTKQISATVEETKESLYSVNISVNGHQLKGDEPEDYGSKNIGPAPYDFLLAALGECTAMTLRWFALQQNWPLEKVEVFLTHEKRGKTDFFTKKITIHGDLLTSEQRQKLHEVSAKCPVHKTLTSEVVIETLEG